MNEQLVTEIYQQLCIDSDENLLASALADKYDSSKFDAAFKKAYERFLKQTAPGYPAKYRQALASYALIAARSFHVCDYKTAKSAIDSKVKLLQLLEAKDSVKEEKKLGRKTTYTKDKAKEICVLVKYHGWSLSKAANAVGVHHSSAFRWMESHEQFRAELSRARDCLPTHLKDSAIELLSELKETAQKATTPEEKARCLSEYRRFLEFMLEKNCPEYKDKQTLEMTGANGTPLHSASIEEMQQFAAMVAEAERRIAEQSEEKSRTIQE